MYSFSEGELKNLHRACHILHAIITSKYLYLWQYGLGRMFLNLILSLYGYIANQTATNTLFCIALAWVSRV